MEEALLTVALIIVKEIVDSNARDFVLTSANIPVLVSEDYLGDGFFSA